MILRLLLVLCFVAFFSGISSPAFSGTTDETRYCGEPRRDASGHIYRSSWVRSMFQMHHPCPSTGLHTGSCEGWQIDHVIPLACGGCDAVSNMQWLPVAIKTCKQPTCKDRFEREIYGGPVPTTTCVTPPIKE